MKVVRVINVYRLRSGLSNLNNTASTKIYGDKFSDIFPIALSPSLAEKLAPWHNAIWATDLHCRTLKISANFFLTKHSVKTLTIIIHVQIAVSKRSKWDHNKHMKNSTKQQL